LALIAAFAMVFIGCGGGGQNEPGQGEEDFTSNLSGSTLKLIKNQYAPDNAQSRGLQGKFDAAGLMGGRQIKEGDVYTLEITFTIDKALDYDLEIGFVDTTVGADEGYWRTLSWDNNDESDDMYKISKDKLTAGATVTDTIVFEIIKSSSGKAAAANTLVFESRDLWSKDPVTLTFTNFIFMKGDGGSEPPPPPPPQKVPAVNKIIDDPTPIGTSVVDIVSASAFEFTYGGAYQGSWAKFEIDFGTGNDITKFKEVSFVMKGLTSEAHYKNVYLIAGEELPASFANENAVKVYQVTDSKQYPSWNTAFDVLLTLDTEKTAALAGKQVLEFCIYDHSGADAKWLISDIEFASYTTGVSSIAVKFEFDPNAFVPVTGIVGIPTAAKVGEEISLGVATVNPSTATNKTIVWSVKTAGAGITTIGAGDKITATEAGEVTITATIADGTAVGTPYPQDFTITFSDLPEFTDATYVETNITEKVIGFAGLDGDNDMDLLKAAKFLVLGFRGSNGGSPDGFGGMQIGIQHTPSQWSVNPPDRFDSGDWNGLSNTADEISYWVIPLALVPHFDTAVDATQVKIVLNHGIVGPTYVGAWLTSEELVIGSGVVVKGTVGGTATDDTGSWLTKNTGLTPK